MNVTEKEISVLHSRSGPVIVKQITYTPPYILSDSEPLYTVFRELFDVLLTVHLIIIVVINQIYAQNLVL